MQWQEEKYHLGLSEIDKHHREFISLVAELVTLSKSEFEPVFIKLCEHISAHFAYEDNLMASHKFSAIAEHRGEHQRVLGELAQLNRQVERGRTTMAQAYVKDRLPEWFALHVATMDSALVAHINKVTT